VARSASELSRLERLARELAKLTSESVNPATTGIDLATTREILRLIHAEDERAVAAVGKVLPQIVRAARIYEDVWKAGGRIFYVGAGTSGRLGVLDAAECPPTFGTDPKRIVGLIAGGRQTLVRSREGVEDDRKDAERLVRKHRVGKGDLLVGLAASRRTPFTRAALEAARLRGARTVFICTNPKGPGKIDCDVLIAPNVGPEVIAGSTRMKAGTAQKLILNMLSTTAMVRSGKTYRNRMVDLQAKSEKLRARSLGLVMELAHLRAQEADLLLSKAGGSVKTALVMAWCGLDKKVAVGEIKRAGGRLRKIGLRKRPTGR